MAAIRKYRAGFLIEPHSLLILYATLRLELHEKLNPRVNKFTTKKYNRLLLKLSSINLYGFQVSN